MVQLEYVCMVILFYDFYIKNCKFCLLTFNVFSLYSEFELNEIIYEYNW